MASFSLMLTGSRKSFAAKVECVITPQEFLSRWGNDKNLITYDPAIIDALNISAASKEFLLEVGLPHLAYHDSYCFDIPPNTLPCLSKAPEPYRFSEAYNHLRLLGKVQIRWPDLNPIQMLFCLDECNRGQIVEVYSDTFVHAPMASKEKPLVTLRNNSVVHLAEVLLLLEEHRRWFRDHDVKIVGHDVFEAHCEDIARRLEAVDPQALQREGPIGKGWTELFNLIRIGEG